MIAPGNEFLILTLALGVLLSSAYAFGRIHQWHKRGRERDEAYRTGYDSASRSILSMMTAHRPAGPARGAIASLPAAVAPVHTGGRHSRERDPQARRQRRHPLQREDSRPTRTR